MGDICVTVPMDFGWQNWVDEGDAAGAPWSGEEWHFYLYGALPQIEKGERVYIVHAGKLRGYAPLVRIDRGENRSYSRDKFFGPYALVRHGGAVAVTIDLPIKGFRGFRYRWWDRELEKPFPEWRQV